MQVDTGISEEHRKKVAEGLKCLLADTKMLYVKTQSFHWNVTGMHFSQLHLLFEREYSELAEAVDVIAERIRALGFWAPGSYSQFAKLTTIKEEAGVPKAKDMIQQLVEGHETIAKNIRELFHAASEAEDEATVDLLTSRADAHEKEAWMLRSLLE